MRGLNCIMYSKSNPKKWCTNCKSFRLWRPWQNHRRLGVSAMTDADHGIFDGKAHFWFSSSHLEQIPSKPRGWGILGSPTGPSMIPCWYFSWLYLNHKKRACDHYRSYHFLVENIARSKTHVSAGSHRSRLFNTISFLLLTLKFRCFASPLFLDINIQMVDWSSRALRKTVPLLLKSDNLLPRPDQYHKRMVFEARSHEL